MTSPLGHPWDLSPSQAIELQKELARRVRAIPLAGVIRTVAGLDCAFLKDGREIVAAAVLMNASTLEVLARSYAVEAVRFPYIPGLLTFREAPAELEAVNRLPERPDLIMVDGAGWAHPRRMGIASYIGLAMELPTIGVAKSRLCGQHRQPGLRRGCAARLIDHGECVGSVVRTQSSIRPIYVSIGHLITLEEAVRWTVRLAGRYRLPEPTRQADHMAGQLKKLLS